MAIIAPFGDDSAVTFRCSECGTHRDVSKAGIKTSPTAYVGCAGDCDGKTVHRRVSDDGH